MSGLFQSKKTELPAPRTITTPQQHTAYDYLQKAVTDPGGTRYTGRMSADPQSYEGYLPGLVESYANRQPSRLYSTAQNQLQKTMEGGYDPYNSEYYKSYRAKSLANLAEAQTQARQAAQIGGMLKSSGRLNTENKLIGATTRDLNSILAGMYEKERGNQLAAVAPSLELDQYNQDAPLRTAQALMGVGGYQTQQQQSALDRMHQDFINSQGMQFNAANILASPGTYNYYTPQYSTEKSPFEQISPLITMAMIAAATGGVGAGAAGAGAAGAGAAGAGAAGAGAAGAGGLTGALGQGGMLGMYGLSDKRLKQNIIKIGKTKEDIGIYIWKWKEFAKKIVGDVPNIGVIAQEVMRIKPEAVIIGNDGYLRVNYSLI